MSSGVVSYLESGVLGGTSLEMLRRVAAELDIRIDVVARWRGGELDRLLNARHSRLAVAFIARLHALGWQVVPEVSFSVCGNQVSSTRSRGTPTRSCW